MAESNLNYTVDYNTHFVLAQPDDYYNNDFTYGANLMRWHGTRQADPNASPGLLQSEYIFNPALSPLSPYFGAGGQIKACPTFQNYLTNNGGVAFEEGTGGYGYNETYVGGEFDQFHNT